MQQGKKPDWNAIKIEYLTTKISYRDLAKKHDVPFSTLSRRAKEENWILERRKTGDKVVTKSVNRYVRTRAKQLSDVKTAADTMANVILKTFDDPEQFNRHLVQTRKKGVKKKDGILIPFDTETTEEKRFKKVDTRAIRDLTSAMKDLTAVLRDLYDMPSLKDQEAIRIASEKLEIEKRKNAIDENDETTGIVLLPQVLEDTDDDEEDCENCDNEEVNDDHLETTT